MSRARGGRVEWLVDVVVTQGMAGMWACGRKIVGSVRCVQGTDWEVGGVGLDSQTWGNKTMKVLGGWWRWARQPDVGQQYTAPSRREVARARMTRSARTKKKLGAWCAGDTQRDVWA